MKIVCGKIEVRESRDGGYEGEWHSGGDNGQHVAIEFIRNCTGATWIELYDSCGHAAGDECFEGTFLAH